MTEVSHYKGPVLRIIERFKKHPRVVAIFENYKDNAVRFKHVSLDEITKEVKRLDVKKACQDTDIAATFIKNNNDIFVYLFFLNLNNRIALSVFPSSVMPM